jgi:rhodanese-related sulfurtransferase
MQNIQEIEAGVLELLQEMQGDIEDIREFHSKLRQTLDEVRATGMPLPEDLVQFEKELSSEFAATAATSPLLGQRHIVEYPRESRPMLRHGFKAMLAIANTVIQTVTAQNLTCHLEEADGLLVDVRETVERDQEGFIPGSLHIARGLLEFKADPESPIYNDTLRPDRHIVLYCGSGGRSTLAAKTLLDMGYEDVCSLNGGYAAWRALG